MDAGAVVAGWAWHSGLGSCCWLTRAWAHGDRASGRVSKPTVIAWKKRYAAGGIAGLEDRPKAGRPARIAEVSVVLGTLQPRGGSWA